MKILNLFIYKKWRKSKPKKQFSGSPKYRYED